MMRKKFLLCLAGWAALFLGLSLPAFSIPLVTVSVDHPEVCLDQKKKDYCDHFSDPRKVYLVPELRKDQLPDGYYIFSVLIPGTERLSWFGGAGNLSPRSGLPELPLKKATALPLSNDGERIFLMTGGYLNYYGTHEGQMDTRGRALIGLWPFFRSVIQRDGFGEYVVSLCPYRSYQVGTVATPESLPIAANQRCLFDTFKIRTSASVKHYFKPSNSKKEEKLVKRMEESNPFR